MTSRNFRSNMDLW